MEAAPVAVPGPVPVPAIVLRLDPTSGVPPYLQIVQQVERALRLGYLRRGDQLPRVKDAVAALAVNPNTVLKAYRQLEQKGLIAGRPGQGTFVEAEPEVVGIRTLQALEQRLVTGWLPDADAAGLDDDAMLAVFRSALHSFRARAAGGPPGDAAVTTRRGRRSGRASTGGVA
jgi:GntR family transcriptional regulator